MNKSHIPYVYLFVRTDLSIPQQIVQTAHAVDELNKRHGDKNREQDTNHMVLCGAGSPDELFGISEHLHAHGIAHEMFYEPDINGHTAIATEPLAGHNRQPLKQFKLLK
jgi:hypothetical protein